MFAKIQFDENGVPRSEKYDDVYHSVHGGFEQSLHVFIEGNQLIRRWESEQYSNFIIFETGFGLGVNFLATVTRWLQNSHPEAARLRFISVEKFLPEPEHIERVWQPIIDRFENDASLHHRLMSIKEALVKHWPIKSEGEFHFDLIEGIELHLCLEDIESGLILANAHYLGQVDAIYLDGFNPAKNPEMWTQSVCDGVASLANPQGTLATWAVTGFVRRQLSMAGFHLEKKPGFAHKREMLIGRKSIELSNF